MADSGTLYIRAGADIHKALDELTILPGWTKARLAELCLRLALGLPGTGSDVAALRQAAADYTERYGTRLDPKPGHPNYVARHRSELPG